MIKIDEGNNRCEVERQGKRRVFALSSSQAFAEISKVWLRCGFENKYVYSFTWFGRPVIQLPEDLLRIQEILFRVKPDRIVETGIAHGGSIVFYASLCKAMGKGRVIGVDKEIRPHNRKALERHPLRRYFSLIEGDSASLETFKAVKRKIPAKAKVLVILDSNHSKSHVLREMEGYCDLVSKGSYLVVADGIMPQLVGARFSKKDWAWNHPLAARDEFLARHPEFKVEEPPFLFNEGFVRERVTYWRGGYLLKTSR